MEQIQLSEELSKAEKQHVVLAVARGCLGILNKSIPGAAHQKRKRTLVKFGEDLSKGVFPQLVQIAPRNTALFTDSLNGASSVLSRIYREAEYNAPHILMNLCSYCLSELPLSEELQRRHDELYDLWDNAQKYPDSQAGPHIFTQIEAATAALACNRGLAAL